MKQWSYCPYCSGDLDTGWECTDCGADWMPVAYLWGERLLDWLKRMVPVQKGGNLDGSFYENP